MSVFDFKLALSFNCQTRVCCCFITANSSGTSLLICYSYISNFGALACSFCHQGLAHAYQNIYNTPGDLYSWKYSSSKLYNTWKWTQVFLVNMTLDKTPRGKTSLEYMSIYEENRWWNTASTKYRWTWYNSSLIQVGIQVQKNQVRPRKVRPP